MIKYLNENIKIDLDCFMYKLRYKEYFDNFLYEELLDELNVLIKARESEDITFIRKNISGLMGLVRNLFVLYISHNDKDDIIEIDFSELGENIGDEEIYESINMLSHKLIVLASRIDTEQV